MRTSSFLGVQFNVTAVDKEDRCTHGLQETHDMLNIKKKSITFMFHILSDDTLKFTVQFYVTFTRWAPMARSAPTAVTQSSRRIIINKGC